jgi:SAM-dependent methyltransferase
MNQHSWIAAPRHVTSLQYCHFYHTMDLPEVGTIEGKWDLRGRLKEYIGGVDVAGKRVLDVGCASGFLSFGMEQMGAEVVSFDADIAERVHMLPFPESDYIKDYEKWKAGTNTFLFMLKNSYWFAHRLLKSKNKACYGDIYGLPEGVGMFDVAVVGQILIHLRDPISALAAVAKHTNDYLVIAEGMVDSDETKAVFHARANRGGPEWLWWQYSTGMYKELIAILGFELVSLTKAKYLCLHEYSKGDVEIATLVARRKK